MPEDLSIYCICGHLLAAHVTPTLLPQFSNHRRCLKCNCLEFSADLRHRTATQELADRVRHYKEKYR